MLRLSVLALLLANALYFGWTQGYLAAYGLGPTPQTEPQRVAQQIRPDFIRIISPEEARRGEAAPAGTRAAECVQTQVLDDKQALPLRRILESNWPAGSWVMEPVTEPARWMVYMGRYPNAEALERKRAELANLNLRYEPLLNPEFEPGLSLGVFDSEAAAAQGLAALNKRGVRTARVVQERPELRGQVLRIAALDDALRPRLEELKASLPTGKPLKPCR